MTATPSGLSNEASPARKPLKSGTCAITLRPRMTSARVPSEASRRPRSRPNHSTSVGTLRVSRATAATLAAGSIPSTGTPAAAKNCSR